MARGTASRLTRIVQDPQIMAGKPVIKGTRVPVARVLRHLADTPDLNDLFEAFPHITMEDVQACLAYAWHRLEEEQAAAHGPYAIP